MHDFAWTEEFRATFKEMKTFIVSPPLLSRPEDGEGDGI